MTPAPIDRRGFLRAAGAGAVGMAVGTGMAGCGQAAGGSSPTTAPPTAPPTVPASGPATAAQWAAFAASLTGRLVRPGDRAYPVARQLYDPKFDALSPVAVAYCATADDVARAISFARAHGYPPAPRCGGHSYGGYSSGNGRGS